MTKGFKKAPENKAFDGAPLNKEAANDVPFDSLDDIFGDVQEEVIENKKETIEKPKVAAVVKNEEFEEEKPLQDESPAERFKRIANRRVNQALKYISLTKNLASRQYEYTPEQVEIVLNALRKEVDSLEDAFRGQSKKTAQINLL